MQSLFRWRQELLVKDPTSTLANFRSERIRDNVGPTSILVEFKHELIIIMIITKWRDKGMPVAH
jgi:hypothetical protein